MKPFSNKSAHSSLAGAVIAIILAAVAVVLPSWDELFPLRLPHLAAIHLTFSSAVFAAVFAVLWQLCAAFSGVYKYPHDGWVVSLPRIGMCSGAMTACLAIYLMTLRPKPPLAKVLTTFLLCAVVCELLRLLIASRMQRHKNRALIIGSGRLASKAWREFRIRPDCDVTLVGFADHGSKTDMCPDIAARYLGGVEDLSRIILENCIDDVIVATPLAANSAEAEHAMYVSGAMGARIVCLKDVCGPRQHALSRDDKDAFFELLPTADLQGLGQAAKRAFDIGVSAVALLLGFPLLLAAAIVAALRGQGLGFDSQIKLGFRRKLYRTYGIRSAPGSPLFRLCLARLPLMWNVLRGEMSLVGPPPLSFEEISQAELDSLIGRFSVRPGLTGSVDSKQTSKRGADALEANIGYADNWSLRTDLKILTRAFRTVIQRAGVVQTRAGA